MMLDWDEATHQKFKKLLDRIPVFLRGVALEKVSQKAQEIAQKEAHIEITEKDMVDAFFLETPFGFHGPLKTDMLSLGIDYTKYGYAK
ncbi:MAG: DUF2621 family protein [Candidatus Omnitrophica bacterium]|nr:DUF2621 family protein [Candidatus Omnitrophota bacterium]